MNFAYPWFLSALAFLAIPIIIHLFNLRKHKVVYFPDIRFLKNIQAEKKSKSKLKQLLILLSRILAFTCLIFAFANPYIPGKNKKVTMEDNIIGIYLDNSFSMQLKAEKGNLLETGKQKIMEIAEAFSRNDRFILTTNESNNTPLLLLTKNELQEQLSKINPSPSSTLLSQIVKQQKHKLSEYTAKKKHLFIISDFQSGTADISTIKTDSLINLFLIPIQPKKTSNIYIDSCWFENPIHRVNQNEKLHVRITNQGEEDISQFPVKLYLNGKHKALNSVSIPAHKSAITTLSYLSPKEGVNNGYIEINDYPITYDNQFYFNYFAHVNIGVLNISENKNTDALDRLYGHDSTFRYHKTIASQIDYSNWNQYSLILLNQLKNISSGLITELKKLL